MATRKYSNKRKKRVNRFDLGGIPQFNSMDFMGTGPSLQGATSDAPIWTTSLNPNDPAGSLNQIKSEIDGTAGVAKSGLSDAAKGLIGAAAGVVGNIGGQLIGGDLQSGAGNAISSIGSTVGGAISAVNPMVGGIVSGASGLLGGVTNALFGSKLNKERINDIEGGINTLNTLQVDDSSTSSILDQFGDTSFGQSFNKKDIGRDGLFSNKAKNTYKRLKREQAAAINRTLGNFSNAADNVQENQVLDSMANYAAYGGPITMRYSGPMSPFGNQFKDGGGIQIKKSKRGTFTAAAKKHGKSVQAFASQVLANKDNYSPAMVKKANFARNAAKFKHAEGGWLDNTNGGIFDNGVVTIGNGGTHEQNPFEGVQMGVDNQGIPNLVEEGEVIFNDYVYSNRIKAPKEVKKKYKLRGNTFADLAENAQKESKERSNDPISQRGLQDIMTKLAIEQESIKARREKRRTNKYAKGGHLYPDGGFTYGVDMLNLDRNINTADLYKQGSDYMNARQYVLDNWDTPYVQNWLNDYYKPFVTTYNKSRGYNGSFNVNRDQFEKGTYDSNFGGMHQGLLNFQYPAASTPSSMASPDSPMTIYTTRGRMGGDISINPEWVENYGYTLPNDIVETTSDADGNTINYLSKLPSRSKSTGAITTNNSDRGGKNKANPLTYLRYAPVLGSTIGLAQNIFSNPDYSSADAILEAANDVGDYTPISYTPIGNYLTYNPFDRDYYINKLNAQAGATRRAITGQSAGNRATAMAGLLAADYSAQLGLGNLARQAEEYNLAQRQAVETFNRATNQYNSEAKLKADMANLEAQQKARSSRLSGVAQAMAMRDEIDARRGASYSANLTNLFNSLGDVGREEFSRNMIMSNPALYYSIDSKGNITYKNGYENLSEAEKAEVRDTANRDSKSKKKAKGGYLTISNRRRKR